MKGEARSRVASAGHYPSERSERGYPAVSASGASGGKREPQALAISGRERAEGFNTCCAVSDAVAVAGAVAVSVVVADANAVTGAVAGADAVAGTVPVS